MAKKFSLLMAAVAVLAFAIPAMANAAPEVTISAGTTAKVGQVIKGESTNAKTQTSLGNITCAKTVINAKLTENTGTSVKVTGNGGGEAATCLLGGKEVKVTDLTLTDLSASSAGQGTLRMTYVWDMSGGIVCHFVSPAGGIPFTYTAGSSKITLTNADFTATPAGCEPAFVTGEFTITNPETGLGLILD